MLIESGPFSIGPYLIHIDQASSATHFKRYFIIIIVIIPAAFGFLCLPITDSIILVALPLCIHPLEAIDLMPAIAI